MSEGYLVEEGTFDYEQLKINQRKKTLYRSIDFVWLETSKKMEMVEAKMTLKGSIQPGWRLYNMTRDYRFPGNYNKRQKYLEALGWFAFHEIWIDLIV